MSFPSLLNVENTFLVNRFQLQVSPILDLVKHSVSRTVDSSEVDSSPLVVEHPSFPARTSGQWLRQHGLKGLFVVPGVTRE